MAKGRNIPSVRKHAHFLKMLHEHRNNSGDRQKLMGLASRGELEACIEIFLNVLNGNLQVPPHISKKLQRYRRQCQCLLDKDVSLERKRKVLKGQVGGFLPLLAPLIPSLLGTIVKPIIKGLTGM